MIIDVHNHFYPKAYLDAVKRGTCVARTAEDTDGNLLIVYEGDFNIVHPGHRDAGFRLEELARNSIDCQVLSMTTPGVHIEESGFAIELAREVNEGFRDIVKSSGGRFEAFAALPLQAPERAADELRYAVTSLGLKGGTLFTNVNGANLDHPDFEPVFSTAAALGAPLFFHPTTPVPSDSYLDFRLAATVGFTVDTTLSISRLIFSGLLDRYPGLKIISSHLGGCLPYLAERLDRGYSVYPELRGAARRPSDYLKGIYYDCVLFDARAVAFAVDTLGASQFMAGSDYPHQIGSLEKARTVIDALPFDEATKSGIRSGNALRVLGMA
ncbi:MAG: amidohydrolase family protein [Bacillota bacterium]|nr:amidohydrolase family protein [Bacillota bacterium]